MAKFFKTDGTQISATIESMVGKRVRSKRDLENGRGVFPAGTLFTIRYGSPRAGVTSALVLDMVPCGHCGVSLSISGVSALDVEVME